MFEIQSFVVHGKATRVIIAERGTIELHIVFRFNEARGVLLALFESIAVHNHVMWHRDPARLHKICCCTDVLSNISSVIADQHHMTHMLFTEK